MTTTLVLSAPPSLDRDARALAASLPLSLRYCGQETRAADAALIDGRGPWTVAASVMLDQGIPHVIVMDPGDADPKAIDALADHPGSDRIVLSETYAGNPCLGPWCAALGAASLCVVETMASKGVQAALLDQLRVMRRLGIGAIAIDDAQVVADAAIIAGTADMRDRAIIVRMINTPTRAAPPSCVVRLYGDVMQAEATLFAADTARPAIASVTRTDGQLGLPTIYETAHRRALREMAAYAKGASASSRGAAAVRELAADMRLLRSLPRS